MATLPQQAPGPGPTAQALPSYLSYSPVATSIFPYTSTITQVVYDPQGGFAPYQTLSIVQGISTSIGYSVVNVPLLYTGPFPAPDLGTLYTTPGQSLPAATSAPAQTSDTGPSPTVAPSAPAGTSASAASSQDGSVTAESVSPSASGNNTAPPTAGPTTSPPASPTAPPTSSASSAPSSTGASTAATTNSGESASPSSSGAATGTTSGEPSATAAGAPNAGVGAAKGLSGGQIAGIVLGAFFALLLLLLLLLCCLRRRRNRRQQQNILAVATGGAGASEKPGSSGFGRSARVGGGARGNYAALGAAAGAAGLAGTGAAAAGRRASVGSDEWEEDHLTSGGAGSGFFVVGGKRLGPDRRASMASRRSRGSSTGMGPSYTTANVAPSSREGAKKSGFGVLAAAGAGLMGAAFGKGRKSKGRVEIEEEQPLSDEDADGSMAERRGLMPFSDSPNSGYGSGTEMREAGRPGSGAAAALLGVTAGAGAAALAADRRRHGSGSDSTSPPRSQHLPGFGGASMSRPASSAFSGSGGSSGGPGSNSNATGATASSQTQRAGSATMSSSNSTGGFTTSGSGTSLPPPPRAPRGSPQALTSYGNLEPSAPTPYGSPATNMGEPSPAIFAAHDPRYSVDTADSTASGTGGLNPALLGLGGLGALAAGHRESAGRSPDLRASHASEMSADELRHLRSTDPERYSRFISTGSNLLGPDYQPSPDLDAEDRQLGAPADAFVAGTLGAGAAQRARLPTIRSVGEFGEKSDSSSHRGTGTGTGGRSASSQPLSSRQGGSVDGGSLGSRRLISPLPVYTPQQLQAGETLPHYTLHNAGEAEQIHSPMSDAQGRFVTPPDSPRNTLGGAMSHRSGDRPSSEAQRYADAEDSDMGERGAHDDAEGRELAGAGIASAGIMGGVAAGWRRLTMGQYAWMPGRNPPAGSTRDSSGELNEAEGRFSYEHGARPSEDSSRLLHQRRASRFESSDVGMASDVRSEHASVYGPSALGHNTSTSSPVAHLSSKEASGSSGERIKANPSEPSLGAAGPAVLAAGLGAVAARQRSYASTSSQSTRSRGGGYAASQSNSSLSRRTGSDSTGLDSLSAVAQLSSRSTGSASTRSGFRSSSRGGRSGGMSEASLGSGASTGAASYSPSGVLSRGNTTSTRGLADVSAPTGSATYFASRPSGESESLATDAAEAAYSEADVTSSRATQGGSSVDRRKRPRSSSVDAVSRLDSLREVREASDPFGDAQGAPESQRAAQGGHYPSVSLGAAVSRSVERDLRQQSSSPGAEDSFLQSQPLPQRSRIRSLQPGAAAPAPTALAPSLSTPSLDAGDQLDMPADHAGPSMPSLGSGSLSAVPASASWRPSPRVTSAAQRAAEAQATLLRSQQQQTDSMFGGPTPPRSQAASPSGAEQRARAGASYNWADLETTFRRPDPANTSADLENNAGDLSNDNDPDRSNRSFDWPKFLRF